MASRHRPLRGGSGCLGALTLYVTLVGACVAADSVRQLSFSWPKPTLASRCDLEDTASGGTRQPLRFTGAVERSDMLGVACTVQIPRRRFDTLYRFCTVTNVDAVPREHYACWVMYSPTDVTFLYSYADDYYGPPACEFECSPRQP